MTAPNETPSLTTDYARAYAACWAETEGRARGERDSSVAFDTALTDAEVEQLFAWVRARMAALCSLGGPAWTAGGHERNTAAGLMALELALEGHAALALIDAAGGWPS